MMKRNIKQIRTVVTEIPCPSCLDYPIKLYFSRTHLIFVCKNCNSNFDETEIINPFSLRMRNLMEESNRYKFRYQLQCVECNSGFSVHSAEFYNRMIFHPRCNKCIIKKLKRT